MSSDATEHDDPETLRTKLRRARFHETYNFDKWQELYRRMDELDIREWQNGDGDSRCQECGRAYLPWFTDDAIWNSVIGGDGCTEDPGGYLCPICFANRVDERHADVVWRFVPTWRPTSRRGEHS